MRPVGRVNLRCFPDRKSPWRAQWREEGRSRSQWFRSQADAEKFQAAHATEASTFGALAVSPTDRAQLWSLRQQAAAAGHSLEAVVAAGLAALHAKTPRSEPLETALGLWLLDACDRQLRPRSIQAIRDAVRLFAKGREDARVDFLRAADLLAWVASRYPRSQESRDDVLARLLTFFRWCAAPPRTWCRLAEFSGVRWAHKVIGERKRIGFWTAAEARALLEAAPPQYRLALATGFFLGVRPVELQRVRFAWHHEGERYGFDADRGEWHLAPEWAKTRAYRRLYDLPDCWWYWYLKYAPLTVPKDRQGKKHAGKLVPGNYWNFRKMLRRARPRAGLGARNPKDGIRHSFGTHGYHRSADGRRGLEWCLDLMGHESGLSLFKKRYQGKVSASEAEAYFALYPDGSACDVKTRARVVVG